MIGIFSRTTELYDALANETRLSIFILLRAKKEMDSKDLRDYLREKSIETLEHHLNILERAKLIQKRDSSYSLTKEGERRLSELGVTETEAIELTREREILIESISQNEVDLAILDTKTIRKPLHSTFHSPYYSPYYIDGIVEMIQGEKPKEPYLYKLHGSVLWHNNSRLVLKSTEEGITHDD